MVKSFKKKKKPILFILYDFQNFFKLFFSKFQFQNWNLGNMWTHNTQTHPPTSPTQHTNTPTDPPKTKTLITHKHTNTQHTTHNPQTHNTEHTTQTLLWLYNRTQKKKKEKKKKKKKKKRVKVSQSAQSDSHTLTDSQFHIKKKKKKMLCYILSFIIISSFHISILYNL